ncbi:uncharacterized protein BXZ73DRAFT_55806 [Epithele typhae]|uniref:uncharacterized protein n=1 Tax=Epithele typhae TaxID=378194 RepID=UPI0020084A88|nr:uncharacterized protein BXZ73DRAFT_55806 [Epithele typhae]KAH9912842.1 hypothetical protein BXZ73DRAFT_55806 [Epithele typhae]
MTLTAFFWAEYLPRVPLGTGARVATSGVSPSVSSTTLRALAPVAASTRNGEKKKKNGSTKWDIDLSKEADKALRRAERAGGNRLHIIVKKIHELREGHFTPDNHKMISGCADRFPIYEAKMDRDSRLVRTFLVINICGIHTHSQVNRKLWNDLGRQLYLNYGAEYRQRCMARERFKERRGDHVVFPKLFPDAAKPDPVAGLSASTSQSAELVAVDPKEADEVRQNFGDHTGMCPSTNTNTLDSCMPRPDQEELRKHQSSCYVLGTFRYQKTTVIVFKMLDFEFDQQWYNDAGEPPLQLFISQSEVLVQHVRGYYDKLRESIEIGNMSTTALHGMAAKRDEDEARIERLVDLDDAAEWAKDIPQRYGELQARHFPLFLSFPRLCHLLENEFRHIVANETVEASKLAGLRNALGIRPSDRVSRFGSMGSPRPQLLDYDMFLRLFWNQHARRSKHALSPELVFSEIIGVIKGSEDAIRSVQGFLSRETYCDTAQREAIYSHFEYYQDRRSLMVGVWYYDAADRTRALIRCLDIVGVPGLALANIFVDECQDNLLADTILLRHLCPNPHGLFWAGDTAQTISTNGGFRFSQLKASNYRIDQRIYDGKKLVQPDPPMFHLAVNHRSHSGIVRCAQAVVNLLLEHWPDSIDRLGEENGSCPGPEPLFITAKDQNQLHVAVFRTERGGAPVDFGAKQAILVRNEAAKERLKDVGHVLTIYQSKGLEFDDVLLYDFFEDSTVDESSWRVVQSGLPGGHIPTYVDSGLCRELKHLYVAMTRARKNLWIADSSWRAEPMKQLLSSLGLIKIHDPAKPLPTLTQSSTAEEWETQARTFFRIKLYAEAKRDFMRAGMEHECHVADAYLLRQEAAQSEAVDARTRNARETAYCSAARAFVAVADEAPDSFDRQNFLRTAAMCFVDGGDTFSAAQQYEAAELYDEAAMHFRKAGKFDHATRVLKRHEVSKEVREGIINVARLHYIKENKTAEARELFEDDDEVVEYMDDYGLSTASAAFLEGLNRNQEAAERLLREGDILKAVELFLLDPGRDIPKAARTVLDGLWRRLPLHAPREILADPVVKALLGHAKRLSDCLPQDEFMVAKELRVFDAIRRCDLSTLEKLGGGFLKDALIPPAILALNYVFAEKFSLIESAPLTTILKKSEHEGIQTFFQSFLGYAREVQRLSCDPDPCANGSLQKLFNFKPHTSDDHFEVPQSSSLFASCRTLASTTEGQFLVVSRWSLEEVVKKDLRTLLQRRVQAQKEVAYSLHYLKPCMQSAALNTKCTRRDCPNFHVHPNPSDAITTYNRVVHIHVLEIMIYHTLYATDIRYAERTRQQRAWLRRLYEALLPSTVTLGSLHLLMSTVGIHLPDAHRVVVQWIQDLLNRLHPVWQRPSEAFLTNFMRATRLAMLFDRQTAVRDLRRVPPLVRSRWWLQELVQQSPGCPRPRNHYILDKFVTSMIRQTPLSLQDGITFVDHLLSRRIPIDISVLCDYLDQLCGALATAALLHHKGSLDCLTVPKSWLVQVLRDLGAKDQTPQHVSRPQQYGLCLERLLFVLSQSGPSAGILHSIITLRIVFLCSEFIFRGVYCRKPQPCTGRIRRLTVLIRIRAFIMVCSRLINANDWNARRDFIFASFKDCKMDEMIKLQHVSSGVPISTGPPSPVRTVVYSEYSDISSTLKFQAPAWFRSSPSIDAAPTSTNSNASLAPGDWEDPAPEHEERREDPAYDAGGEQQEEFTPEQVRAAAIICKVCLAYLGRKNSEKAAYEESVRATFMKFRKRTRGKTVSLRQRAYHYLYLGPVPHLLVAVEGIKNLLLAQQSDANKELVRSKDHLDLEKLQDTLNTARYFKEADRILRALVPSAEVHDRGDPAMLRQYALAAQALVARVDCSGQDATEASRWKECIELTLRCVRNYERGISQPMIRSLVRG